MHGILSASLASRQHVNIQGYQIMGDDQQNSVTDVSGTGVGAKEHSTDDNTES